MADFKETVMGYTDQDDYASFCTAERKWVTKILKYKETHPDKVTIIKTPQENHGILLAHIPKNWFKMSPPRQVNYSEEYKSELAERLKAVRRKSHDEESQNQPYFQTKTSYATNFA